MMKSRVLFIGSFPTSEARPLGGIATSCVALTESRLMDEFEFDFVDSTARFPLPGVFVRGLGALRRMGKVVSLLIRRRPDALLVFTSPGLGFLEKASCVALARLGGVPSLLFVRGGAFMDTCRRSPSFRWVAGQLLRAPAAILCQGEVWQDFFHELYGHPRSHLPIIRNWTATPELLRIGQQRTYGTTSAITVLFVGRINGLKGIFELLSAFREIRQTEPTDCRLVLAGDGPDLERAREWVRTAGIEDNVSFTGWVIGDDKTITFEAADVFVLPSYAEGLPNAMIEAMSCGLPVIMTSVGSIPDVIQNDENGILIRPRDESSLREALLRLIRSSSERERLGQAGYRTASAQFTIDEGVTRIEQSLRGVMGHRQPNTTAVQRGPQDVPLGAHRQSRESSRHVS